MHRAFLWSCAMWKLAPGLLLFCAAGALAADSVPRLVEVSGHGEATASPDRARLSLSAQTTGADVKAAETIVNRVVRDTLAMLRAQGVAESDIGTTGFLVQPQYSWRNNIRHFDGYQVDRTMEVTVRDLGHLGDVLIGATSAGINQVGEPQLESSTSDEARRRALKLAVEDARANAQIVAQTLGVSLGPAHNITANANEPSPPRPMMAMARAAVSASADGNEQMGLTPGLLRYSVEVRAQFDLGTP
jgi:hypothetical protein